MTRDPSKPIIDSLLEEVVGRIEPPDLTDRIMSVLNDAEARAQDAGLDHDLLDRDLIDRELELEQKDGSTHLPHVAPGNRANKSLFDQLPLQDFPAAQASTPQAPTASTPNTTTPNTTTPNTTGVDAVEVVARVENRGGRFGRRRPTDGPGGRHATTKGEFDRATNPPSWISPVFWMACGATSLLLFASVVAWVVKRPAPSIAEPSDVITNDDQQVRDSWADDGLIREREQLLANGGRTSDPVSPSSTEDLNPFRSSEQVIPSRTQELRNNRLAEFSVHSDGEVIQYVNFVVDREIQLQQVTPTALVGDEQWLSRVFESLLGRQPSAEEITAFQNEASQNEASSHDRRESWVDRLLNDQAYELELSQFWAGLLTDQWLGNQPPGTDSKHRRMLRRFLTNSIHSRQGMDQIVFDLITAAGSDDSESDRYDEATGFLLGMNRQVGKDRLSGHVARAMLGRRLDCVQCHQLENGITWKQDDYYEFDAFFRQMRIEREDEGHAKISDRDFTGMSRDLDNAAIFYDAEDGRVLAAYPTFNGQQVTTSGRLDVVNRRVELAGLVVESPQFRQLMVNRIWKELFGVSLSNPVDDMGDHNPVSHPGLLVELSEQLAAHQYQLRPLLKWMVLSRPFAREEGKRWELVVDAPHLGRRPLFSRRYMEANHSRSLQSTLQSVWNQREQLAQLDQGVDGLLLNYAPLSRDMNQNANAGNVDNLQAIDEDLANGFLQRSPEKPWGVSEHYAATLEKIVNSDVSLDQKINHLFLIGLSRPPSTKERELAKRLVEFRRSREGVVAGLQDVWWTLQMNDRSWNLEP